MKEFVEVLKNNPNGAFDYISNNYYKFSKDELKDIIKELLYSIEENTIHKSEYNKVLYDAATELEDFLDLYTKN